MVVAVVVGAFICVQSYLLVKQSTLSKILSVHSSSTFHIVFYSLYRVLFQSFLPIFAGHFIRIRHPTNILIIYIVVRCVSISGANFWIEITIVSLNCSWMSTFLNEMYCCERGFQDNYPSKLKYGNNKHTHTHTQKHEKKNEWSKCLYHLLIYCERWACVFQSGFELAFAVCNVYRIAMTTTKKRITHQNYCSTFFVRWKSFIVQIQILTVY